MNTFNNKRKQMSKESIKNAFTLLLQTKSVSEISVTELCKLAHINRTTFYANYESIDMLCMEIGNDLQDSIKEIYYYDCYDTKELMKILKAIRGKQDIYSVYYKLNLDNVYLERLNSNYLYDGKHEDLKQAFFMAGFNAVIKRWIQNNCMEKPIEIKNILVGMKR